MTSPSFICVCDTVFPKPDGQSDFSCPKCGRVYNYLGQFLWHEPGSPSESDARSEDQDEAMEKAFEAGTLPEQDNRSTISFDEILPEAPLKVSQKPAAKKKK